MAYLQALQISPSTSDPLITAGHDLVNKPKKATFDKTNPKCNLADKDYAGALMAFIP